MSRIAKSSGYAHIPVCRMNISLITIFLHRPEGPHFNPVSSPWYGGYSDAQFLCNWGGSKLSLKNDADI